MSSYTSTSNRVALASALRGALVTNALRAGGSSDEEIKRIAKPSRHAHDFVHMPLNDLARHCLLADGHRPDIVSRLSANEVAMAAWGFGSAVPAIRNSGLATNITATLPQITLDAFNKSLLAGYGEAPQTWRGPMRQAQSVPDFKNIHRVRMGAIPNLPDWPDNTEPTGTDLVDEKVTYAVEAKSRLVDMSWRLFVNDDLDFISRVPRMLGDAAARTVNAAAWAQITNNAVQAYDSVALFATATGNRKRDNLVSSGAAPSTAQVGAMKKLMRLMHGLNDADGNEGADILNLTPKYIVCPAALEQATLELVRSGASPADNKSSAVFNTAGTLEPIIEPLLDADSADAYYLFADPVRVDTVEVTFLQGQESPFTHSWVENATLARKFSVVQTFAAKAIDHRGIIKNNGT